VPIAVNFAGIHTTLRQHSDAQYELQPIAIECAGKRPARNMSLCEPCNTVSTHVLQLDATSVHIVSIGQLAPNSQPMKSTDRNYDFFSALWTSSLLHEYMNVMYNNWCGSEAVLQIRIKLPDSATSYLA
jgi:hypothetical protein